MNNSNSNQVAKIENIFVLNAQYRLTTKEQKIFFHLVTHLDPKNEKEFHTITVPLKEIELMLRDNDDKYGSFYEKIEKLCDNLMSKMIRFPSNVLLNGKKLKGRINFFSSINPQIADNGETVLQFAFSPDMTPFLLQLHHYVNIGMQEIVPMSNTHAIRMYSIFKCEKDRLKGVKEVITMKYFLEELKSILGINDKYKNHNFSDFKVNVLDKIRDDINENVPSMSVDYNYIKTARKVTGVTFNVLEKQQAAKQLQAPLPLKAPKPKTDIKAYTPSDKEIGVLSPAKLKAYYILLNYGIFAGIAYKQILPNIKGSEFEGYEDFFIERAIQHFEKTAIQTTTKELKASTFVTWWTKNKVFESGDVWVDILEKLGRHKKQILNKTVEKPPKRVGEQTISAALNPLKTSFQKPEMFNIEYFQEQHPELYAQFLAKAVADFEKFYMDVNQPFVRSKFENQILERAKQSAKDWTQGQVS
jgi:plasmid replication initiation protein